SAERVAAAAAFGALMGARGNSGVITSQILRGLAEGLAGKTRFNALDLANALDQGTKAAYGAVAKPVEGTILTVIREASAAAAGPAVGGASAAYQGAPPGAGMRDQGFGFETMFLALAEPGKPLDVDAIRNHFESIGESVLVAGDARAIKVHIHNEHPDEVLA